MKGDKLIKNLASIYSLIYTEDIKRIVSILNKEIRKEACLKNCFTTIFSLENELNLAFIIPDKFYEKSEFFIPKYQVFCWYIIGLLFELCKKINLSLSNFHNILIIQPDFVLSIPTKMIYLLPQLVNESKYHLLPLYFKKIKLLNHYKTVALRDFINEVEKTKFIIFNEIPKSLPKKANQITIICGKKKIREALKLMKKISFASLTILKAPLKDYFQMILILKKSDLKSTLSQDQNNDLESEYQINVL